MKSRRLSAAAFVVAVIFYLCLDLGFKVWAQKLKKREKKNFQEFFFCKKNTTMFFL
jgi:hypothetical protein